MNLIIGRLLIGAQSKFTIVRVYCKVFLFDNKRIVLHSISHKICYRDNFQIKLLSDLCQLRQARHRSVFIHHFYDHSGRSKAGKAGKINSSFGMPCSSQHSAFLSFQRKNMSGFCKIPRFHIGIGKGFHRFCAV